MKKFLMLVMMFLAVGTLIAQEDTAKKGQEPPARDSVPKQAATPAYKLAFAIYELQEGKRLNQRDYSLIIQADSRGGNMLKIGTKVPIETGNNQFTYAEVGFIMEATAVETVNNKLAVSISVELSNLAIPEQNAAPRTVGSQPVIRAVTQRVRTVLTPGKPQVITSMDDVNSNKRMQVEVTATKVD